MEYIVSHKIRVKGQLWVMFIFASVPLALGWYFYISINFRDGVAYIR